MPIGHITILDRILGPIGINEVSRTVQDQTFIDRLNYYYTIIFLLFFAILTVTEEMVGSTIQCFLPVDFSYNMVRYAHDVCWVSNTFYIPFYRPIPPQFEVRRTEEVMYYQYVPLIMIAMSGMFILPHQVWKYCSQRSGVSVKRMLEMADELTSEPPDERFKRMAAIAGYIDSWCSGVNIYRGGIFSIIREAYGQHCNLGFGRHYGNYLVTLCVGVKFLYVLNAAAQLYFLNAFLSHGNLYIYGYQLMYSVIFYKRWIPTRRFPIHTICDFDLRQLNNVQRWTVQCVLPINLYNEKIFIFLWFWISLLVCLSTLNFLYSIFVVVYPRQKTIFVKKYLKMLGKYNKKDYDSRILARRFSEEHLRQDGVFLLKLLSNNLNTVGVMDVMESLWEKFLEREDHRLDKLIGGDPFVKMDMTIHIKQEIYDGELYESAV